MFPALLPSLRSNLYLRSERSFFFLHIPKTAGTSLISEMRRYFDPEEVFPRHGFHHLRPEEILNLPGQYKLFTTHGGFDIAKRLGFHVFTVLRDPIDRICSLYNFWNGIPEARAKIPGTGKTDVAVTLAKTLPFDAFVCSEHPRIVADIENAQTFQVIGSNALYARKPFAGWSEGDLLQRARDHLASLDAVGATEDLPAFLRRLHDVAGWDLRPGHRNRSRKVLVRREDLPSSVIREIERRTGLDRALHGAVLAGEVSASAALIRKRRRALRP